MATFYKKTKLLKGLLTGKAAYIGPSYVSVDVTLRCNLQCLCCLYHSPLLKMPASSDQAIKDMPFSLFEKLCHELKIMGTNLIIIEGEGEPFLHPYIFNMISAAKGNGFQVMLFTNGTLLDESNIYSLIDSKLDILEVSLWAGSPEVYQQNNPGSNSADFGKIVDGLKLLAYHKAEKKSGFPSVELCHPINHYNFQHIKAIVDLAFVTGCNSLFFSPVNSHRGKFAAFALSAKEERFLRLSMSQIKKKLDSLSINHNIDQALLRYKIGEGVWEKLPCYIGWYHTRIKVDGKVLACNRCDLPMGNLNENTLLEIWNGSAYRNFRKNTLTCKGLASMDGHCNCGFCCHVVNNKRIHKLFRWFSPFARQLEE